MKIPLASGLQLPRPKAVRVDPKRSAVVVVDMQNDYLKKKGKLYAGESGGKAIEGPRLLVERARKAGVPIVYTQNWFQPDDQAFKMPWWNWPKHCIAGTWGARIVNELKPQRGDPIIRKKWYDAFAEPKWGMESTLRKLGADTLVMSGFASNVCVMHTSSGAAARGFKLVVPVDAIATFDSYQQDVAVFQISLLYNAAVTTSKLLSFRP